MFFKSFVSKNQIKNGDAIWMSICGNICIIIDAVSISKNPEHTKKSIIEFLNEEEDELLTHSNQEIITQINDYLVQKNDDMLASLCILRKLGTEIHYSSVGNTQILKATSNQTVPLIAFANQPESVLGMKNIEINSGYFSIENDATYIAATDGLDFREFKLSDLDN